LFTVAVGDGIVVVSSLVVGEALDDGDVDDGDVEADEDDDDDEPDGMDEGVAEDDGDGLGDGDEDMADDDGGVDGVVDDGDGVVDEDDDVDDGGVTSVLRWQPEAAASASAAARTRGIDRTVMRISGNGDRDARHPTCGN